jgi:hypothetical protein
VQESKKCRQQAVDSATITGGQETGVWSEGRIEDKIREAARAAVRKKTV